MIFCLRALILMLGAVVWVQGVIKKCAKFFAHFRLYTCCLGILCLHFYLNIFASVPLKKHKTAPMMETTPATMGPTASDSL